MLSCFLIHNVNLTSSSIQTLTKHIPQIQLDLNHFLLTWDVVFDAALVHIHIRLCKIKLLVFVQHLLWVCSQHWHNDTMMPSVAEVQWLTVTAAISQLCANILRLSPCSPVKISGPRKLTPQQHRDTGRTKIRKGQWSFDLVFSYREFFDDESWWCDTDVTTQQSVLIWLNLPLMWKHCLRLRSHAFSPQRQHQRDVNLHLTTNPSPHTLLSVFYSHKIRRLHHKKCLLAPVCYSHLWV